MPVSQRKTWKAGAAVAAPAGGDVRTPDKPGALAPPRDLAELRLRLDRLETDRREMLADAAGYAIEHPHEIAFGAAPSVARRCAMSPTSVGRLAHSPGFKGFGEMGGFFQRQLRDSRCWKDDRPRICSSSQPTKAIQAEPSIGDDGFRRSDFISIESRT